MNDKQLLAKILEDACESAERKYIRQLEKWAISYNDNCPNTHTSVDLGESRELHLNYKRIYSTFVQEALK